MENVVCQDLMSVLVWPLTEGPTIGFPRARARAAASTLSELADLFRGTRKTAWVSAGTLCYCEVAPATLTDETGAGALDQRDAETDDHRATAFAQGAQ